RPRGQVSDSDLDRELHALFGADPSPEFIARVRTRVADEPRRLQRWPAWPIAASAFAIAAAVALAVVVTREARPVEPQRARLLDGRALGFAALQAPGGNGRRLPAVPSPARFGHPETTVARDAAPPTSSEPEVLIDPRETAALRALIFGVRDRRIDLAPVAN